MPKASNIDLQLLASKEAAVAWKIIQAYEQELPAAALSPEVATVHALLAIYYQLAHASDADAARLSPLTKLANALADHGRVAAGHIQALQDHAEKLDRHTRALQEHRR